MRLKVAGVETIEITDPGRACGRRKKLDPELLQNLKGQEFTASELKLKFGYGKTTALTDTQLMRHIEPVKDIGWEGPPYSVSYAQERATKWRIL